MAKLATCPGCTTQLALPEDATLSDRARCPRCHEEFLLMETVQFSIPTAEILPSAEPQTFNPTDTLNPTSYTPTHDPYTPADAAYQSPASNYESASESIQSTPEPEPAAEQPSASATLSDWEARLKRAIAGGADETTIRDATNRPSFELTHLTKPESRPVEPVAYEAEDYSVPDADLIPATPSAEIPNDWSAERSYSEEDEEPTVKFAGDQTISSLSSIPQPDDDEKSSPAVRTDTTPSLKKRKRSLLRTLASASLGVVGIPLGLYALLWLRGPEGDMLHVAQYLPSFMLPSGFDEPEFDHSPTLLVEESAQDDTAERGETEQAISNESPNETPYEEVADAEPIIHEDAAVAPASAELPTYQGPTFEAVEPAEFSELLLAAQQTAPQLSEGDLETKESVASKGQAYMALARLADKMSFLSQSLPTTAGIASAQAAENLFETMLSNSIVQRDIPQIALRWWQYADRPSRGIVLVGEVKRLRSTDAGTIAYLSLGVDSVTPDIPVLMWRADYQEGDMIGIAGSIEPNPAERLPAIDSTSGPLVIAHTSFRLRPPH
jgi:hypothetical protein